MPRIPGEAPKIYRPRIIEEHITAAIQMTAVGCNPFSVHVVVKACTRLIRDLAEHRGIFFPGDYRDHIKDEFQTEYLSLENKAYNFAKHADRDPDAPYDGPEPAKLEMLNEIGTLQNIQGFRALGGDISSGMGNFTLIMMAKYPQYLKKDAFAATPEMREQLKALKPEPWLVREMLRRLLAKSGLWPNPVFD